MWQQAARSLHLHPILLHKADGKRIVLEAAQKDNKVSADPKIDLQKLKLCNVRCLRSPLAASHRSFLPSKAMHQQELTSSCAQPSLSLLNVMILQAMQTMCRIRRWLVCMQSISTTC
jgi:hypothetical protein